MASQDTWYQLPPDMNQWQTAIIENVSRKIPEIPQYIAGIDFNRVDPIMGDADGLMYLLGGLAAIPITVRQNRLAPLDLMVTKNEEFYPVSEAFLQKVYADNVLGEPSNIPGRQDDLQEDGPARQIKYYNTVDKVKQASYEQKVQLRTEIEKSASLLTFFDKYRPEILSTLYTAKPDVVKQASEIERGVTPDIHFLAHDGDAYTFNAEPITVKEASQLMDAFGMNSEAKASILKGGHVCLDHRTKHASVVISNNVPCEPCGSSSDGDTSNGIATVITVGGIPAKGFLHRECLFSHQETPYSNSGYGFTHLFISPDFHSIQDDIHVLDFTPCDVKDYVSTLTSTEPSVGMFGVVAGRYTISMPIQVSSVQRYGNLTVIRALSNDIEPKEYTLGRGELFYQIPSERISLVRNADDAMLTMPGKNYMVSKDTDGNIMLDGEASSYINAVYSMMDKMAMEYDDAVAIADKVITEGRAVFKVAEDKSEDKPKDKGEDKGEDKGNGNGEAKKDGPPPKEDKKDIPPDDGEPKDATPPEEQESEQRSEEQAAEKDAPPHEGQLSPEEQAAEEQAAEEQAAQQGQPGITGPQTAQQALEQQNMDPVKAEDLEDIAKINDPTLMDAYLSGKLTDVNTAGREQMMQASDAIVNAIKAVGKVLFLVRLGKVDYVKEEDAQMALNKLSDVARSIGVASSQLM